ncbi:C-type lectin 37Db isoform X1 [Zeugodacus cucurbitae]|uniref:Collectin-46 n=1 Tax=Zeugodacus cucurbitae TaxID=28588 RepID=A0A0A1XPR5_ZEUCU|nr:C-type lectin 37Db isoform X1 [Zeugodacus cucurbitae]
MLKTKTFILILCLTSVLSNPLKYGDTDLFTKIGEKYYIIFSAVKMNWYAAANYCRTFNGDLVTIDSETELKGLHVYLHANNLNNTDYWISGNDLAEEGTYVSLSTGRPLLYTKYAAGEPDNSKEQNCLLLDVFKESYMYDYPCNNPLYVICEKRRGCETYATGSCENISTDCALKTLGRAYLLTENTFDRRA